MAKDNQNNRSYTKEQRSAMLSKLLPHTNMSISELSAERGIPKTTLISYELCFKLRNVPIS